MTDVREKLIKDIKQRELKFSYDYINEVEKAVRKSLIAEIRKEFNKIEVIGGYYNDQGDLITSGVIRRIDWIQKLKELEGG